ncbi:ferritin-like domain-containing protein [Ferruginibacter profundus]
MKKKVKGNPEIKIAPGNGDFHEPPSKLLTFFTDELKDIYWGEIQHVKVLTQMLGAATNEELENVFSYHLEQTGEQVTRLEQIFKIMGEEIQAGKCEAIEGLTREVDTIIDDTENGTATRDVGLIVAAQKIEHYEIATYGSLLQLAGILQMDDELIELLKITLDEEKEADKALTRLAENKVNQMSLEETEV